MRSTHWTTMLTAALIAGFAAPSVAQDVVALDVGENDWVLSSSKDRSYSVETPCTAEQVAEYSQSPLEVSGQALDEGGNVSCFIGTIILSSGIMSVPADEIGVENLFDVVLLLLRKEEVSGEVAVTEMMVDGRRVILSREIVGTVMAHTGVVELSNRKLLMLIAGGEGPDVDAIASMIDRHVRSVKVAPR